MARKFGEILLRSQLNEPILRPIFPSPMKGRREDYVYAFEKKLTNIKRKKDIPKELNSPTKKQRTNPKMRKLVMVSRFVYLQTNRSNPQSILKDTLQKTNRIEIVNNHACEEKNLISRLGPLPMDTSSCFLLENVSETTKEDRLDATRVPRVYGGN